MQRLSNLLGQVKPAQGEAGACGSSNTPRSGHVPDESLLMCEPCAAEEFTPPEYYWPKVHDDLEAGNYAGCYGWDNAAYWGIAEKKAGVDLKEWYKTRTEAEFYLPEFKTLIDHPETQTSWDRIATFDPMGMYAHPPTISACKANLDIPELKDMPRDGNIVKANGEIVTSKAAIYYAWNLPMLCERLDLTEEELREALFKYSNDNRLLDPKVKTYIPAVGGCTVYTFGDVTKLRNSKTEVCVRVHDECIGSDVFGSDICSCRPYLIFALRQCIECAQRGGVGVVVYYRKEGRSLGEVIKFRVYNARINQAGGDRSDTYFHHTEAVAGIRDARFQTMMPDALNWLGIKRIDWLCSMSNEKYEAIVGAGITVMERVSLPEDYIKESMRVELDAKVASGYHQTELPKDKIARDLRQLGRTREQCLRIYELAQKGSLAHFALDESKMSVAVDAVEQTIKANYPDLDIPMHSRMRHFGDARIKKLWQGWQCDQTEKARRLFDLVTVSVLLDAGAGPSWSYSDENGQTSSASEGLAAASLDMFLKGLFSSDPALPVRANSFALQNMTSEKLGAGLQVSPKNPLIGFEGRVNLLKRLGDAMEANPSIFGAEVARPGNMVDYVMSKANGESVSVEHLWHCCTEGLHTIWPLQANGILSGDVWLHSKLAGKGDEPGKDIVPFHKLTQWLVYSLMDVLQSYCGVRFSGHEHLTALSEYRNGGLFIDTGVLQLKDSQWISAEVNVGTELVIEWRALTVILVDKVADELRKRFGKTPETLSLSAVLEGGTWRAGREVAKKLRPDGGPPLRIRSDGTVF